MLDYDAVSTKFSAEIARNPENRLTLLSVASWGLYRLAKLVIRHELAQKSQIILAKAALFSLGISQRRAKAYVWHICWKN